MYRKIAKWIVLTLGILLGASLLLLGVLPPLLSSSWGSRQLAAVISSITGKSWTIGSLQLHWLGNQNVEQLTINHRDGSPFIKIDQLQCSESLAHWILHPTQMGDVTCVAPQIYLNIFSPSTPSEKSSSSTSPFHLYAPQWTGLLQISRGALLLREVDQIVCTVSDLHGTLTVDGARRLFDGYIQGEVGTKEKTGNIELKGKFKLPSTELKSLRFKDLPPGFLIDAAIHLTNLPLGYFVPLFSDSPTLPRLLTSSIGEEVDVQLHLFANSKDAAFHIDSQGELHQSQIDMRIQEGRVRVLPGSNARFTLLPAFWSALFPPSSPFAITQDSTELTLISNNFWIPLTIQHIDANRWNGACTLTLSPLTLGKGSSSELFINEGKFNLTVETQQLQASLDVNSLYNRSPCSVKGLITVPLLFFVPSHSSHVESIKSSLDLQDFPLSFATDLFSQPNLYSTLLGETLNVHFQAKKGEAELLWSTPYTQLAINGITYTSKEIQLTQPLRIDWHPPASVFTSLTPNLIHQLSGCSIEFAPFKAIWNDLSSTSFSGLATIENVQFLPHSILPEATLNRLSCAIEVSQAKERCAIEGEGSLNWPIVKDEPALSSTPLRFHATAPFPLAKQTEWDIESYIDELPTQRVLSPATQRFAPLLGELCSIRCLAHYLSFTQLDGEIKLNTPYAQLTAPFSLRENQLTTPRAVEAEWQITPASWATWKATLPSPPPFNLVDPFAVTFSLSRLQWPLSEATSSPTFAAACNLKGIAHYKRDKQPDLYIKRGGANASTDEFTPAILNYELQLATSEEAPSSIGSWNSLGKVTDWWKDGRLNGALATISSKSKVDNFPLSLCTAGFTNKRQSTLLHLVGSPLNFEEQCTLSQGEGKISAFISTPQLNCKIKGELANEQLTLTEPLKLSWVMSTAAANELAHYIPPQLIRAVSARSAFTLEVPERGTVLPLNGDLSQLQIPPSTLKLGQISCINGGVLSGVIDLLRLSNLSKEKTVNVWFTPAHFSITNGKLTLNRTDLLAADAIHCATWGEIDLPTKMVNMAVAIGGDSLVKLLTLQSLPESFMLPIAIKGSTLTPQIQWTTAAAQLSALIASEKVGAANILNAFLQQALPIHNIPPPLEPFPWQQPGKE